jgi:hypothetical protein
LRRNIFYKGYGDSLLFGKCPSEGQCAPVLDRESLRSDLRGTNMSCDQNIRDKISGASGTSVGVAVGVRVTVGVRVAVGVVGVLVAVCVDVAEGVIVGVGVVGTLIVSNLAKNPSYAPLKVVS